MPSASAPIEAPATTRTDAPALAVDEQIRQLARLLPQQRPISIFVHLNTLQAFEDLPFADAVVHAADLYDRHPFLPEHEYRAALERGRIRAQDLAAELFEELDLIGDELIGRLGTRHELWLDMLRHPLREGPDEEIHWFIAETESLYRFRPEATAAAREQMIAPTRRWLVRDYPASGDLPRELRTAIDASIRQFGGDAEHWNDATWQAVTLHLLWEACRHGARIADEDYSSQRIPSVPLRQPASPEEMAQANALVNVELIKFCGVFLDQGLAAWSLPARAGGLLRSFVDLYGSGAPADPWLEGLEEELQNVVALDFDAAASIEESLAELRIRPSDRERFLLQTMLGLRGFAGMIWQLETNAEWAVRPAPPGSLVEYVATRLILLRLALRNAEAAALHPATPVPQGNSATPPTTLLRAFRVFQLAQTRSWSPVELLRLRPREWRKLLDEIDAFSSRERRKIYHYAYERRLREDALCAVRGAAAEWRSANRPPVKPSFQMIFCIDDREESLRRHLEEVDPTCQTFGYAGFFGVAMYYRGVSDAHYKPLCPVGVVPRHYVMETPVLGVESSSERQALARKLLGQLAHNLHFGSRTLIGGALATLAGAAATLPLVLRILFPHLAGRMARGFGRFVIPQRTHLTLERLTPEPGPAPDHHGYQVDEMAGIVSTALKAIGMTHEFAPLVLVAGHGSGGLNNPHIAAYHCGACAGGKGSPNARAFAQMANDPRVRAVLASQGIVIPETTRFLASYHNTADDEVEYFGVDGLQETHRGVFLHARRAIDEARMRDAHERSRRFQSAPLTMTTAAALKHVEERASDLSQVRVEIGHATNAYVLVGRREWSRGLFLDRRAFLPSYDPTIDDEQCSILARTLSAVIPVCGGISLDYYFSRVDNRGYGCGTKLPHNITSLIGIMDGAGSDLRNGLPWQMVELHEPVRILFVIETSPAKMQHIIEGNPTIEALVCREWVQLATFDVERDEMHLYRHGEFVPFTLPATELPVVATSTDWYRGQRDNLGFALVQAAHAETPSAAAGGGA